jgi:multiple sugar transport system substrate-binding protein
MKNTWKKGMCAVICALLLMLPVMLSAAGAEEEAEVKEETVVLAYNEYFTMSFGPAVPPIEAIQQEVAKLYPNITVEFQTVPLQAEAQHDTYVTWFMSQDSQVDILGVGAYWTAEFGEANWLVTLEDKVDPDILAKLDPSYLDAHSYNGHIYGLGPWWGGIGGLYYRTDLLEAYGFAPPETYDELVKIAEAIMADNPQMSGWTWPAMNDTVLVNRWTEFLYGFGGKFFNADGSAAVNSQEAVDALTFMRDLISSGVTPLEATNWKEEDSQTRFVNGNSVFHSGRQDMMFWLDNPEQSKVVGKWGFIPNPARPNGESSGFYEGWAFSINRYTDVPDAALKVLEVMFDFPVQKLFNLSQGPLQAHVDVYSDPDVLANNPNMDIIYDVAVTAKPPLPSPNYVEISDILRRQIHSVLTGQSQPKAALDQAAKEINAIR